MLKAISNPEGVLKMVIDIEIKKLIKLLEDYDQQEKAKKSLIKIGEPAIGLLIQALSKKSDICLEAIDVLEGIGKPIVDPLIVSLKHESAIVRSSVGWAIYKLAGKLNFNGAVRPLIDLLNDRNANVQQNAVMALGEIGDRSAVEPIILFLRDNKNSDKLITAIEALANIKDARAVEPIAQILLSHKEQDIKFEAALALGEIGEKSAVEALFHALDDKAPEVRWRAALSLGEIGDHRAINPLRRVLKDKDQEVRDYAAEAIGKLGDTQVYLSTLKNKLSRSADSHERSTAAEEIAEIGSQGLPILLEALIKGNINVCYDVAYVIWSVLMKENKEVLQALYEALKPASERLTKMVSKVKVIEASPRSYSEEVSAAIAALGFIGNSSAIPVLENLLTMIQDKIKTKGKISRYVQTEIASGFISNEDDILHIESAIDEIKEREATRNKPTINSR
jgi:HEAT repeat protein